MNINHMNFSSNILPTATLLIGFVQVRERSGEERFLQVGEKLDNSVGKSRSFGNAIKVREFLLFIT